MHFVDKKVLSDIHHINFIKIVPHSWKMLRVMWKITNAEYIWPHYAILHCREPIGPTSKNFVIDDTTFTIYECICSPSITVSTVVADLPEEVFGKH